MRKYSITHGPLPESTRDGARPVRLEHGPQAVRATDIGMNESELRRKTSVDQAPVLRNNSIKLFVARFSQEGRAMQS